MKKILLILLVSAAVLFGAIQSTNAVQIQTTNMNIADTLYYSGQFDCFSDLMERADLNRVLKGRGPYTVFAPTDAALAGTPPHMLARMGSIGNECQLNRAMRYHIIPDCLSCQQIASSTCLKTTDGRCITVCPGCNSVKLDNANIVQSIYTSNGVIHVVDNLLMPGQQLSLR